MYTYFPKSLSNKSLATYLLSLVLVSIAFVDHSIPWWLMLFGVVPVFAFFSFANRLTIGWNPLSSKYFSNKLFWSAFFVRVLYVFFIYFLNYKLYGTYYESNEGDITWYVPTAEYLSECFHNGSLNNLILRSSLGTFSDSGYVVYLTVLYVFTFNVSSVILPLVIKSILGALTCVHIYKVASNHFDESVAKMAGIFCMLQFNMIWWCGSMMKETEMIFLMSWFLCRADSLLMQNKSTSFQWITTVLIGLAIFSFRTALGLMCFASLFATLLFADKKVVSTSKKVIAGVFVVLMLFTVAGDRLINEAKSMAVTAADTSYQERNMEWRTKRGGMGNKFAKYAGAAVFAPLIFTIPFPSMVYTYQGQEMQVMVNGGNYVKNVLSFFVIFAMFYLLFSGEWRKHIFPIALLVGYLVALVFSVFGHSGRFHMPAVPLEMMFAAYGFAIVSEKKKLRWFKYALAAEFVFIIAWNWVKLSGRGMA